MLNFFKKKTIPKKPLTLDEYIQSRKDQGEDLEKIRKDLLDDLAQGGPIFGDFKKAFRPTFSGSKVRFKDGEEMEKWLEKPTYRWMVDIKNSCPDCRARHGKTGKMEEWEKEGLPGTGKTQCGKECKCILATQEEINAAMKNQLSVWLTRKNTRKPPCPACLVMEGVKKTDEEWKKFGYPWNKKICTNDKCRCACLPEKEIYEIIKEQRERNSPQF